jgi:hypothetical protein
MTRHSLTIGRRRHAVAAAFLAAAVLPLSGCIYSQIPTEVTVLPEPTPTPEGPEWPTEVLSDTMYFEDWDKIPVTAVPHWEGDITTLPQWVLSEGDPTTGNWAYTRSEGSCSARVVQSYLYEDVAYPGEDSKTSDSYIAVESGIPLGDVMAEATTRELDYMAPGAGKLDARQYVVPDSGGGRVLIARAFTITARAVLMDVTCADGDAASALDEIFSVMHVMVD